MCRVGWMDMKKNFNEDDGIRELGKGFAKAEESLVSIFNNHNIDKDNVVFAPGNHDFSFSKRSPASGIKFTQEKAKEHYTHFYKKIIGVAPNEFCAMGRKILLNN